MYERKSRLSSRQQNRLVELFVMGSTARAAGELVRIQSNTAARYFLRLRKLIASKLTSYEPSGKGEAGERCLDGVRNGNRGGGEAGKVAVFGLLKRGGKVYTAFIPNARSETLMPIIEKQVGPDGIVYSDTVDSYTDLAVSGFRNHQNAHARPYSVQRSHFNGIENFWNQAARHLRRFNGIKPQHFYWYLKECEWRFNGGTQGQLLKQLKHWVNHSKR